MVIYGYGVPGEALNVSSVNKLRTGDENSLLWRFFFTTVKDR
jgi:hypothetical protein